MSQFPNVVYLLMGTAAVAGIAVIAWAMNEGHTTFAAILAVPTILNSIGTVLGVYEYARTPPKSDQQAVHE